MAEGETVSLTAIWSLVRPSTNRAGTSASGRSGRNRAQEAGRRTGRCPGWTRQTGWGASVQIGKRRTRQERALVGW
jgi:hypothetical protein